MFSCGTWNERPSWMFVPAQAAYNILKYLANSDEIPHQITFISCIMIPSGCVDVVITSFCICPKH